MRTAASARSSRTCAPERFARHSTAGHNVRVTDVLLQVAGVAAAVLLIAVAAYQVALASGVALGEATMGGRAPTVDGVLTAPYRVIAAVSAVVLLLAAWIVLTRAGVLEPVLLSEDVFGWATWAVVAFTVLNTLSNLSGRHPLERYGMSAITVVVAILTAYVALAATS